MQSVPSSVSFLQECILWLWCVLLAYLNHQLGTSLQSSANPYVLGSRGYRCDGRLAARWCDCVYVARLDVRCDAIRGEAACDVAMRCDAVHGNWVSLRGDAMRYWVWHHGPCDAMRWCIVMRCSGAWCVGDWAWTPQPVTSPSDTYDDHVLY